MFELVFQLVLICIMIILLTGLYLRHKFLCYLREIGESFFSISTYSLSLTDWGDVDDSGN